VANLERGRARWPYLDTLRRLADGLGLGEPQRAEFMAAPGRRLALGSVSGEPRRNAAAGPPASTPTGMPAAGTGTPAPRQLPAGIRHFTGRIAQLDFLTALLDESQAAADPGGTVMISAIHGVAGAGKTALAVRWAYQHAQRFPDGQLYADLRGFDAAAPVEAAAAVRRFLEALGVPCARIPDDGDAQLSLYRSLLADRRTLIVLDNARDSAQVRPLLPGAGASTVLVISHRQLTGLVALDGAAPLAVGPLTLREARELLARRLGAGRVGREQPQADELIRLCGRLPLALNIAAARALTRPWVPLRTLAAEMRAAHLRLAGHHGHLCHQARPFRHCVNGRDQMALS
jgi:hypothetical protein